MLYMLLEWVLKAPDCRSQNVPEDRAADAGPWDGRDPPSVRKRPSSRLYWGESKLHAKFSSCISSIIESVSSHENAPDKLADEIRILRASLRREDFNSDEAATAIKAYFNPYETASNKVLDCYACLAGFDTGLYEEVSDCAADACENEFRKKYEASLDGSFDHILEKLKAANLGHLRFSYFLLPFPSVEEARSHFQTKLWGGPA